MAKFDRPVRLLLVDDEAAFVAVLQKRLKVRGIESETALSGAEAVRTLRGGEFDLAVLDLKMEDMDGIEVLKIFKTMAPDMPVIMLTGHGSEQAARDGLKHGAAGYLLKPCELEDILDKVAEVLEASRAGGTKR